MLCFKRFIREKLFGKIEIEYIKHGRVFRKITRIFKESAECIVKEAIDWSFYLKWSFKQFFSNRKKKVKLKLFSSVWINNVFTHGVKYVIGNCFIVAEGEWR